MISLARILQPIEVSEDEIGLSAIDEAGPGGHFFGTAHTMERYKTAFYSPFLSDWSNFEQWEQNGSVTAVQRANRIWKKVMEAYQAPPMDPAIREELEAFVERRKEEGGAPTDF